MDWDSIGAFALFLSAGGFGMGLVWLVSFRMKLKHKLELARLGGQSDDAVDQLRDEMHDLIEQQGAQLVDMQERLDFAERLLTKGRDVNEAGAGADRGTD